MALVIKVSRIVEDKRIAHVLVKVDAIEVIVPDSALRDHEEAEELVRQDHLHLLVHLLAVRLRVRARHGYRVLLVLLGPLQP